MDFSSADPVPPVNEKLKGYYPIPANITIFSDKAYPLQFICGLTVPFFLCAWDCQESGSPLGYCTGWLQAVWTVGLCHRHTDCFCSSCLLVVWHHSILGVFKLRIIPKYNTELQNWESSSNILSTYILYVHNINL